MVRIDEVNNNRVFCYWCGYSSRDKRGICTVCYPPGHPSLSVDKQLGHVLHSRNPSIDPSELNPIPGRIQPYVAPHVDFYKRSATDSINNDTDSTVCQVSTISGDSHRDSSASLPIINAGSNATDNVLVSNRAKSKLKKILSI